MSKSITVNRIITTITTITTIIMAKRCPKSKRGMLTASYAKINLFLELIGKLPNNYHQVNTILCSIDLFDLLNYELIESPEIILTCNIPSLISTSNLIYRVASYVKERFNVSSGIKIHLEKHIPISAGLGGGSSNAANCILALNEMWQLNLSKPQMHKIASQFGSDVNFFLEGGTAKGENRGEVITKLPSIFLNNILLVNPGIEISSAEAYKLAYLPKKQEQRKFDPSNLIGSCFNRLESGIRSAYPVIDNIINTISNFGAKIAMMSGSGSTCFGIFDSKDDLKACQQYFDQKGFWTYATKTINISPR